MLDQSAFVELKASGNLPSPKGSALKVLDLCQRDSVTLPQLIQALQVDPAMVGRILKMANSASFGRPRPAVALTPDVLMSIGIQSVRQMVLAFSLVSGNRQGQCPGFDYEAFWSRSAATAVAMQLLGAATRAAPPAELFTVGLLANIGRLALAAIHPQAYGDLLVLSGGKFAAALTALEKHTFGYTHLEVAAAMMRDWGLPRLFADAVLFHEAPEAAEFEADSRGARLVRCMSLASRLADVCFLGDGERRSEFGKLLPQANELGIEEESLAGLGDQMLREWAEWGTLLDIVVRDLGPFSGMGSPGTAAADATDEMFRFLSVLVVDDDPTVALVLNKLLAAAGHAVHLARDGQEGLAQAFDREPQLLIVDLFSERAGGLELVRKLRQTELGRSIYIIVLTAADDDEGLAEAIDSGADDYVGKPLDPRLLQARLKAARRVIREQQLLRLEQEQLRRRLLELSITSQHAQEAALTDVLTGLYNRRHAMDRLAQEWAEAERSHRSLSVLMLDIDYFKAVNDSYGHDAGDAALRHIADILRALSRACDVVCRYGGEEFLLILPDTARQGALQLAERVKSVVEQQALTVRGAVLKMTASIGVAEKSDAVTSHEQLVTAADDALYRAKRYGRNRVEVAT
jgi:diguanylate cyclase (GGDEF)-like protein